VEAREVHVVPRPGERLEIQHGDMPGTPGTPGTPRIIERRVIRGDGKPGDAPRVAVFDMASGVSPDVHREVIRIGRNGACKDGSDCRTLALSEAFRWNGLNLASVDEQLGRYFGTRDGVLVVSAGPDLAGLQSGDVIRKVDGKAVSSPRDVMDVLRTKPEGETVAIDYLRDRAPGSARLKAPKAMRIPLPPMPRAAPAAPVPPAPSGRPAAAPTPPSPAGIARLAPPRPPVHAMAPVFRAPPAPPHFRRVD
jgi:hypothetical protein